MNSHLARLLFLRLTGILTHGFLLVEASVLFVFGLLELFTVLAFASLALTWAMLRPAAARALARYELAEHNITAHVDAHGRVRSPKGAAGITERQYARLSAALPRFRARRALHIPRDRFDTSQAVSTTLVWLFFLGFMASVSGGA